MPSSSDKTRVRVVSHRRVYDGKILSLELDEIREAGGAKALREVVRHRGSEERRVGKECGYQCRSRWSPYH